MANQQQEEIRYRHISRKLNLDDLKDLSKEFVEDFTQDLAVPVMQTHIQVSKDALSELLESMFEKAKNTVRIASGLAIAKGKAQVTSMEIKQANEMVDKNVDDFLPQVSW